MNSYPPHWPGDFAAFTHNRTRVLDRMAADAVLREIERGSNPERKEPTMEPIVVEGDLTILTDERRLVIGYFAPGQCDLADVIRHRTRASEAFGVSRVGPVRITIEPIDPPPSGNQTS